MTGTWTTRDLPVLTAIVAAFENDPNQVIYLRELQELTGLSQEDLGRAMANLSSAAPPFIEGTEIEEVAYPIAITRITERALQAAGQWPSPDSLVAGLIAALNQAADTEQDLEKKSRLKETAQTLGGIALQVVIGWASGSLPHP